VQTGNLKQKLIKFTSTLKIRNIGQGIIKLVL
jgi:hypothetical protein